MSGVGERLRRPNTLNLPSDVAVFVQSGGATTASLTLGEFMLFRYFPRLEERLKIPEGNELHIEPSTVDGYRKIYRTRFEQSPITKIPVRTFTTGDGQKFLEAPPQHFSHQTHLRIKNFLSGVFNYAIQDGKREAGSNPMDATKVGGVRKGKRDPKTMTARELKKQASNAHAYTLDEAVEMLDKLPEPSRTVCAVAAFTGLTRSELGGLKWIDYDGERIQVRRKVWQTHIGAPKTQAREAGVEVIPVLRKILARYKTLFPPIGEGWIFRGEKLHKPLDLDNMSRRDIPTSSRGLVGTRFAVVSERAFTRWDSATSTFK